MPELNLNLTETVGSFVLTEARYPWLIGPEGEGKCMRWDTPVLMFDGTVKMVQDIVVGDRLMGPDSTTRTVVSLGRGREEMFEVVPRRGVPFGVNGSHILTLKRGPNGRKKNHKARKRIGEWVDLSVREYLTRSRTFKQQHHLFRVPVEFTSQPIPIDPYWLGTWLGDGTSCRAEITTMDQEIVEAWSRIAAQEGLHLHRYQDKEQCARYTLTNGTGNQPTRYSSFLKTSGLIRNKHIPHLFRANSRENRLALLAGLIDTDGWINRTGYQLIFKQRQLAEDVAFLARSLGFASQVKPRHKALKSRHFIGLYHHVNIDGACHEIPVRLKRKEVPLRRHPKDVLCSSIKAIRPLGVDDYFGFTLAEGPHFLLGDFTVTHNTYGGMAGLLHHAQRCLPHLGAGQPMRGAIIRDTHVNLKLHTVESIKRDYAGVFEFHDDMHKMVAARINVDLFGMDDMAALNRIQGGQYDVIWLEEPAPVIHSANAGLRHEVFQVCARRIRGGKTPKRLQVTMNPASKDHWTYVEAVMNPLTGTEAFWIKPGDNAHLSSSDRKAREEIFRNRPDLKARYDEGKFADVFPGERITPEYSDTLHLARHMLQPMPGVLGFRFWDGGLNPTCIFAQITPGGQLRILDSVLLPNRGMQQLIEEKVLYVMGLPRWRGVKKWRDLGDNSLKTPDDSDSEHSPANKIEELLETTYEGGEQRWDLRREAIKTALGRMVDGQPFLVVSPHVTEGEPFNRVHMALTGGYAYKVTASGNVLRDGPNKEGPHSHPGDALTHALARLFFRVPEREAPGRGAASMIRKRAAGYAVSSSVGDE